MARIETENGDTFEIAEATRQGDESGVHFEIDGAGAYLLTPSEARRIATVLTTMANKVDAKNA
jgi:hypothetical protein